MNGRPSINFLCCAWVLMHAIHAMPAQMAVSKILLDIGAFFKWVMMLFWRLTVCNFFYLRVNNLLVSISYERLIKYFSNMCFRKNKSVNGLLLLVNRTFFWGDVEEHDTEVKKIFSGSQASLRITH